MAKKVKSDPDSALRQSMRDAVDKGNRSVFERKNFEFNVDSNFNPKNQPPPSRAKVITRKKSKKKK